MLETEAAANLPVVALASRYDDLLSPGMRASMLAALAPMRLFVKQGVGALASAETDIMLKQRKQLEDALVEAYDRQTLPMMVRQELDERLEVIVFDELPLKEVVFRLVQWALDKGRIAYLIAGACAQNPEHPKVQAWVVLQK
ncbi:MAG: hypothetical protein IPK16_24760 [Anaerolineales bacterium]|nr:hypothetical protein [Anaerolineales bacterium]